MLESAVNVNGISKTLIQFVTFCSRSRGSLIRTASLLQNDASPAPQHWSIGISIKHANRKSSNIGLLTVYHLILLYFWMLNVFSDESPSVLYGVQCTLIIVDIMYSKLLRYCEQKKSKFYGIDSKNLAY
jgi:hypothetical protein